MVSCETALEMFFCAFNYCSANKQTSQAVAVLVVTEEDEAVLEEEAGELPEAVVVLLADAVLVGQKEELRQLLYVSYSN